MKRSEFLLSKSIAYSIEWWLLWPMAVAATLTINCPTILILNNGNQNLEYTKKKKRKITPTQVE